jgi:hypothetical protein
VTVGLGIVTYKRPDRYRELARSVRTWLSTAVDEVVAVHDGPAEDYDDDHPWTLHRAKQNAGVAASKNWCLLKLVKAGHEWIFISEDDLRILDTRAVTGYLHVAEQTGQRHLNFHAHGPANRLPMRTEGPVTLWPNIVGAWSLYHRDDLIKVGYMDVEMINAFEHVEHTARLMVAGACHRWPGVADATGSEYWLEEQEGAIEDSSIPLDSRFVNQRAAIRRWRERNPETLRMIFGPNETVWELGELV